MPSRTIGFALGGLAILALTGPAMALDEIIGSREWRQVDYAEQGRCRGEVRSNGLFYRIAGQGQRPGEEVRVWLQNEDVRPVEHRVVADGDGRWRDFYVPFLWHRDGGTVRVSLASERCRLDLSFEWVRRRA